MKRFTYFDEDRQEYVLKEPVDNLAYIIGLLEDYKEAHEPTTLTEYLIGIRKHRRLTQKEFANLIHIERSTLANCEAHRRKPTVEMLINISNYADIPLEELKSSYRRFEFGFDDDELDALLRSDSDEKHKAEIIGRFITCERSFVGLSKHELAEKLQVSTQRITKLETGQTGINFAWLLKVAQALQSTRLHEIGKALYAQTFEKGRSV